MALDGSVRSAEAWLGTRIEDAAALLDRWMPAGAVSRDSGDNAHHVRCSTCGKTLNRGQCCSRCGSVVRSGL